MGLAQTSKWVWVLLWCWPALGQVTLKEAVNRALSNYPAVRVSQAETEAAGSGVELARTAYLPRTDVIWLSNRATTNNIFGMLQPQSVLPNISGPPVSRTRFSSVWGSAAGTLFSWEPFDFGLRRANVETAEAVRRQADRRLALTRFEVAARTTDAFLGLVAAQEAVRSAQANVERARVFAESVGVLVQNQLRPGADQSRAQAELAAARTALIRAEQTEQILRATLAEWMNVPVRDLQIQPGRLLEAPIAVTAGGPLSEHPVAALQSSVVQVTRARQHTLERAYYPRFALQSSFYARGSGAQADGRLLNGLNGLAMNTPNWTVGVSMTFPLFDYQSLRARRQIEASSERAEAARYEQRLQELNGDLQRAFARLEGARRIAENTPVQLQAARTLEQQATVRYKAGLAAVVEIAEAQRLLTEAEIEDALARLGIWQALFAQAAAEGNLTPIIEQSGP
jgi:outer membrane protein